MNNSWKSLWFKVVGVGCLGTEGTLTHAKIIPESSTECVVALLKKQINKMLVYICHLKLESDYQWLILLK